MKKIIAFLIFLTACQISPQEKSATDFLTDYSSKLKAFYTRASEASWLDQTHIVPGDDTNAKAVQAASEAMAAFTGSAEVIQKATDFLAKKEKLKPATTRQLQKVLYAAGNNPQTVADIVKARIAAETKQSADLFGFDFKLHGETVTPNDLDQILSHSTNLTDRLAAWTASKEVGIGLKNGLVKLRELRNKTVQGLGYPDFFSYQVSDYGVTTQEMLALNQKLIQDIWPLYREIHTWARYELAKKYATEVPDELPAHWLPNRWGQDWSALVKIEGLDLDAVLKEKGAPWLVKTAENFYVSLGFPSLPASFYEKSSLYPVDPKAGYKKNTHASAWHVDLDHDVRSLMSVLPNTDWYETTHHELGHIYYFLSYSKSDVPLLFREGANRAYHEAIGTMVGLASTQKPYLEQLGLADAKLVVDQNQTLLKEALQHIVFIPFASGTMTHFEHDLYSENLSPQEFNKRWWHYVKNIQGISPPTDRGETFCDAATKTHINDDSAQYYDYPLSTAILFQIHNHIAKNILKQDPHATNYYGNKEVGDFLRGILSPGSSGDWRELLKKSTGQELNGQAVVEYFAPLMGYLKQQNQGRTPTLAETPNFEI